MGSNPASPTGAGQLLSQVPKVLSVRNSKSILFSVVTIAGAAQSDRSGEILQSAR